MLLDFQDVFCLLFKWVKHSIMSARTLLKHQLRCYCRWYTNSHLCYLDLKAFFSFKACDTLTESCGCAGHTPASTGPQFSQPGATSIQTETRRLPLSGRRQKIKHRSIFICVTGHAGRRSQTPSEAEGKVISMKIPSAPTAPHHSALKCIFDIITEEGEASWVMIRTQNHRPRQLQTHKHRPASLNHTTTAFCSPSRRLMFFIPRFSFSPPLGAIGTRARKAVI